MANSALPGFLPVKTTGGGFARRRHIVASSATTIRKGDAVIWSGSALAIATVTTTAVAGGALGASYKNADGERIESVYLPSDTYSGTTVFPEDANYVYLPDDNINTEYKASVVGAIAWTDINLNYPMVLGTTTTKYSDHTLTATSRNTTATLPWRVTGFVDGPESDPDITNAHVYCKVNAGFMEPGLTTTGS